MKLGRRTMLSLAGSPLFSQKKKPNVRVTFPAIDRAQLVEIISSVFSEQDEPRKNIAGVLDRAGEITLVMTTDRSGGREVRIEIS